MVRVVAVSREENEKRQNKVGVFVSRVWMSEDIGIPKWSEFGDNLQ